MTSKVADRSPASGKMAALAAKGRVLMGGTDAMREAGETYLPKFPAESKEAYDARLASSWLFNGYRKTARDMAGKVFANPVELGAEYPSKFKGWEKNIDNAGNDLSTFALRVFHDGLTGSGISYIMVDAPARDGETTQGQAAQDNLRPFMVHLSPEEILGWKTETTGNVTRLSQIRIMESVVDETTDEFVEEYIAQVRVLDLVEGRVRVRLYREIKEDWVQFGDDAFTDMDEITVVPFYANRAGFFTGEPLLSDLADVNIAHWQSQSDQRNVLHFARVPVYFASGVNDGEDFSDIGSGTLLKAQNSDADLKIVEHSGKAIEAGRQDLKDLEFQMEAHGLQLLTYQAETATGAAIESSKETSTLAMTADALKDALEQALIWMGEYGGEAVPDGAAVSVNKEYGVTALSPQMVTALNAQAAVGNLSKETLLQIQARGGVLPSDIDITDELIRIKDEGGEELE